MLGFATLNPTYNLLRRNDDAYAGIKFGGGMPPPNYHFINMNLHLTQQH